jgi:anti-anti-sigma factor
VIDDPALFQPRLLRTEAQRSPEGVLLLVSGELDLATAPQLEAALAAHLRSRPQTVIVDLSRVTFIDCAGLNVLLRARRRARYSQSTVRLGPVSTRVARVLTLTGTDLVDPTGDAG